MRQVGDHGPRWWNRSSFQAWARCDGWIEMQPFFVGSRAGRLVIDGIVVSARFDSLEVVNELGHPAMLAVGCPSEAIDRAERLIAAMVEDGRTVRLIRHADGAIRLLVAGSEIWMLRQPCA